MTLSQSMFKVCLDYIWSIIGGLILTKGETGFYHQAIVYFLKQSEVDLA